MQVDLVSGKVIRQLRDPKQEEDARARLTVQARSEELERRQPTRVAEEADVPNGSVLSAHLLGLLREGRMGLRGTAPRFLTVDAEAKLARATRKRQHKAQRRLHGQSD